MSCKTFQWSHHPLKLGMSSMDLKRSANMSDVTLLSHDLVPFKAHRIILSSCSHFFKTVFQSQFSVANMTVFMKDLYQPELQSILEFIYFGETTVSEEESERFILACKELKINHFCDSNGGGEVMPKDHNGDSNSNTPRDLTNNSMDIEDEVISSSDGRPRRSSATMGAHLIYHLQPNHNKQSCVICFNEEPATNQRGLNTNNSASKHVREKSKVRKTFVSKDRVKSKQKIRNPTVEVEYEVEAVLDKRILNGVTQYFVKWENYEETTWEPVDNLVNITDLIDEFERSSSGT